MTNLERKVMKMALEALERCGSENYVIEREAIAALRQALAQPEQEPVAWIENVRLDWLTKHGDKPDMYTLVTKYKSGYDVPLYTAPPKREWVGLTDEEKQFFKAMGFSYIDIVEAKLKEKNT